MLRGRAIQHGLMDTPNERSSHEKPTPSGGGIVIIIVTIGIIVPFGYCIPDSNWYWSKIFVYVSGALIIATFGLLDDLRSLPRWIRFASHSLVGFLVIIGFGYWNAISLPLLGKFPLGWAGLLITFLWIVGLINVYNFMDGIDGIAGGQAVVAGVGWALLGWIYGQSMVSLLGLILAASSLGFLFHNWAPANVFMGDVGSTFLGYSFAVLPIAAAKADPRLGFVGVLLVWPFIFDTFITLLRRLHLGENIFDAHRSHLYQRLVIAGHNHCFVASLYIVLALIGLLLAFLFATGGFISEWLTAFGLIIGASSLWLFVSRQENRNSLLY